MSLMAVPVILARAKAMASSATAYTGNWENISSGMALTLASPLVVWVRMKSAGSPSVAISLDYSLFKTTVASANGPGVDPFSPSENYLTEAINATFTAVWDGTVGAGGWTQYLCPTNMKIPFSSVRFRAVVSTADVTSFDLVVGRVVGCD